MSETYIIDFSVRPGRLPDFHRLLGGVLDAMRGEKNFRNAILLEDPEDAHHLTLVETWADSEDVQKVQLSRRMACGLTRTAHR